MWSDNNQNLYTNWDHNGSFDHQIHHHYESPNLSVSATFEGTSNNGGIVYQTASDNRDLHLIPQGVTPIGLNLRKSNSLINLVEMTLSQEREHKNSSPPTREKLKASNFPALLLQVGSWKRVSRNEGDLVAKLYYAKKKLVWEFLDGPLKSKIEIQWSEISAIRALLYEGEPGHLEIELNQPPQFGRETNPQPRKHTQWKQTTDFTGGQASVCRRHSILFAPGVLDRHYEKLLQCDNRLFNLSQQPFPVNNYPFFYHDPDHFLDHSYPNVNHPPHNHFSSPDKGSINENQERVRVPAVPIGIQDQFLPYYIQEFMNSGPGMSLKEIDYVNDVIPELQCNYEIGIQESNYWIDVPNLYGFSWEARTEDLGCSNEYQHYYPNYT